MCRLYVTNEVAYIIRAYPIKDGQVMADELADEHQQFTAVSEQTARENARKRSMDGKHATVLEKTINGSVMQRWCYINGVQRPYLWVGD
ncbi:MAG: hypothetical protein ACOC32_02310 [Nanoarchaeota archaeon]